MQQDGDLTTVCSEEVCVLWRAGIHRHCLINIENVACRPDPVTASTPWDPELPLMRQLPGASPQPANPTHSGSPSTCKEGNLDSSLNSTVIPCVLELKLELCGNSFEFLWVGLLCQSVVDTREIFDTIEQALKQFESSSNRFGNYTTTNSRERTKHKCNYICIFLPIYLKWDRVRKRRRREKKINSHMLFILQISTSGTRLGWGWGAVSPTWLTGTQLLKPSLLPLGVCMNRKLELEFAARVRNWTQVLWRQTWAPQPMV